MTLHCWKLVAATQRKSAALFMSSVCGVFNDLAGRGCYEKFEGSFAAGMLFAAEELLKLCKRMRQLDVRKLFHKHTIAV